MENPRPRFVMITQNCLWMLVNGPYRISPSAFVILCLILIHHAPGRGCWPSYKTLEDLSEFNRKTVIRCIKELKDLYWVSVDKIGQKNRYKLLVDDHGLLLMPFATKWPTDTKYGPDSFSTREGTSGVPRNGPIKSQELGPEHTKEQNKEHIPPCNPPRGRRNLQVFDEATSEYKLASLLRRRLILNNTKADVPMDTPEALVEWSNVFHSMLADECYSRSFQDIAAVIFWCQADNDWRTKVLTPRNLKRNYTKLAAEMNADDTWDSEHWIHVNKSKRPRGYLSKELGGASR